MARGISARDLKRVQRRLHALLRAKGWTAAYLIRQLSGNISPQNMNAWLNGNTLIPVGIAIEIGLLTDTHIRYIYEGLIDSRIDPDLVPKLREELRKLGPD